MKGVNEFLKGFVFWGKLKTENLKLETVFLAVVVFLLAALPFPLRGRGGCRCLCRRR